MGPLPIILGIVGLCVCWLPGVGWIGVALGALACGSGVPSVIYWFKKDGYAGWGIAGITIGAFTTSLGLAYQVKHSFGQLDILSFTIEVPVALGVGLCAVIVTAIAMWLGARKQLFVMVLVAYVAVATIIAVASSALTTFDRALLENNATAVPSNK